MHDYFTYDDGVYSSEMMFQCMKKIRPYKCDYIE
jgi:hypothetical protein